MPFYKLKTSHGLVVKASRKTANPQRVSPGQKAEITHLSTLQISKDN
jgi:hypothetical protein